MGILSLVTCITVASVLGLPSSSGFTSLFDQSSSSEKSQQETAQVLASRASNPTAVLAARTWTEINIRSQPTTRSAVVDFGYPGDSIQVLDTTTGYHDSYTWYQVRHELSGQEGWVRGDLIYFFEEEPQQSDEQLAFLPEPEQEFARIEENTLLQDSTAEEALADDAVPERSPTLAPGTRRSARNYTQEEVNFFLEIAMGAEYGNVSPVVRKWNQDIKVRLYGSPTAEDQRTLRAVVDELNALLDEADPNSINIEIVGSSSTAANVEIYIVPHSQFRRYEPGYVSGNLGFAWPRWRGHEIYTSKVYITSTDITQSERSHLIREEFTQSLGLMRDTTNDRYINSMFYQWWTDTTEFTALDRTIITMLYRPDVELGMDATQVASILNGGTTTANRSNTKSNSSFVERIFRSFRND